MGKRSKRDSVLSISLRDSTPRLSDDIDTDSVAPSTPKTSSTPSNSIPDPSPRSHSDDSSLAPPYPVPELTDRLHKMSFRDLDTAWAGRKLERSKSDSVSIKPLCDIAAGLIDTVKDFSSIAHAPIWTEQERQEMQKTLSATAAGLEETVNDLAQQFQHEDEIRAIDDLRRSYEVVVEILGKVSKHESKSNSDFSP